MPGQSECRGEMVEDHSIRYNVLSSAFCLSSACTTHAICGSLEDLRFAVSFTKTPVFLPQHHRSRCALCLKYPPFPKVHPTAPLNYNSSFKSQFSCRFLLEAFPASRRQSCVGLEAHLIPWTYFWYRASCAAVVTFAFLAYLPEGTWSNLRGRISLIRLYFLRT